MIKNKYITYIFQLFMVFDFMHSIKGFLLMFCVHLCLGNKHAADLALFPTGHGLLAVMIVYKGGAGTFLLQHCMCV